MSLQTLVGFSKIRVDLVGLGWINVIARQGNRTFIPQKRDGHVSPRVRWNVRSLASVPLLRASLSGDQARSCFLREDPRFLLGGCDGVNTIGVGLYGLNGHQIHRKLEVYPQAELVAAAAVDPEALPQQPDGSAELRHYDSLDELLRDDRVALVSLCSPMRSKQAHEAIRCLEAGKHVYAEKPCAMSEEDLDAIIAASARTGMTLR